MTVFHDIIVGFYHIFLSFRFLNYWVFISC